MATPDCDWIGIGPAAVSRVGHCVARNCADLARWRCDIDAGRLAVGEGRQLTPDDRLRAEVVAQLLGRRMIRIREIERAYNVEFRRYFAPELAWLARHPAGAHLCDRGERIEVLSPGWPWLRTITGCFEAAASPPSRRQEARRGR